MRYWLTTHWPPLSGEKKLFGVYICDGREEAGRDLRAGDRVLIYETRFAPDVLRKKADGTQGWIGHEEGREGIIALAELKEDLRRKGDEPVTRYRDRSTRHWCWRAEGEIVNVSGFVERSRAARILGYKPSYNFRGFGKLHSGLRQIDEGTYRLLVEEFKRNRPREKAPPPKRRFAAPRPGHGLGGEGRVHEALKKAVYSEPSETLGVPGLKSLCMEFQFETGDRADVVLEDFEGRYITVEIESSVVSNDLTGILQAVKYRYMYAVKSGRRNEEVLAFLVAHEIDKKARDICSQYDVRPFEVPRP